LANVRRELRNVVEDLFCGGIEDLILPQNFQPSLFIRWDRRGHNKAIFQ
jgi:hypothetical protein